VDVDRTAARLRCAVTELVAARLPGFWFYRVGQADAPALVAPLEFYVSDGPRFTTYAVAADGRGGATLALTVARPGTGESPGWCAGCAATTGSGGEQIGYRADNGSIAVEVHWGQTVVDATVFTQDLSHWNAPALSQPRDQLPLRLNQLIEIATDFRLNAFVDQ
jgi:hypothetical protein